MTWIRCPGHFCIYCGERPTTDEHWPPQSLQPIKGFIFPACSECNSIAGTMYPTELIKRGEYVKQQLRYKNENLFNRKPLTIDELLNIDDEVELIKILALEKQRRKLISRIAWQLDVYFTIIVPSEFLNIVDMDITFKSEYKPYRSPKLYCRYCGRLIYRTKWYCSYICREKHQASKTPA